MFKSPRLSREKEAAPFSSRGTPWGMDLKILALKLSHLSQICLKLNKKKFIIKI
jgi:hypothetical protein